MNEFLRLMRTFITSRSEAMLYLLQREPWDFCFLQMQCVDFLQHPLWKFLDASHPEFRSELQQRVFKEFFEPLDQALGVLLAAVRRSMGEETLIVVLSDHGFQRHLVRCELNHWLFQNGFLTPQSSSRSSWARSAGLIRKLDVLELRKRWIPKSRRRAMGSALRMQSIDYERSLAFAVSSFWGYVYLGPRATNGDVEQLRAKLLAWRDPDSDRHIVKAVHLREKIYRGEALDRMPDLIVEPVPGYTFSSKTYFRNGELLSPVTGDDFHLGTHEEAGIFIVAGPEVPRGEHWQKREADLQDVMPTLLHWLGLPVPAHCDGRVRDDWFHSDREVVFQRAAFAVAEETRLSDSEQGEIEKRLQSLGYL